MATEKQIEANRRNAQLSTGPKTAEGKAVVSHNALKHGFRSDKIIFDEFNQDVIDELREELTAQWQPQNYTERALVEQMAIALHKLAIFEALEGAGDFKMEMHQFPHNLQIIWRRQAALERSFHKAVDTLLKLRKFEIQSQRAKAHSKPAEPPAATQNEPMPEPPSPPAEPPTPGNLIMLDPAHPPYQLAPSA